MNILFVFNVLYMYRFNKSIISWFYMGNEFSLIFPLFRYYDDDNCVRYVVTMLSVLFGAGAVCGTADFMGESCYIHFLLLWWLCYNMYLMRYLYI